MNSLRQIKRAGVKDKKGKTVEYLYKPNDLKCLSLMHGKILQKVLVLRFAGNSLAGTTGENCKRCRVCALEPERVCRTNTNCV